MTKQDLENSTLKFLLDNLSNNSNLDIIETTLDYSMLILEYTENYNGIKKLYKISNILDNDSINDAFIYASKVFPNL